PYLVQSVQKRLRFINWGFPLAQLLPVDSGNAHTESQRILLKSKANALFRRDIPYSFARGSAEAIQRAPSFRPELSYGLDNVEKSAGGEAPSH
ncbi:MAG: hypothetical protein QOJ53_2438, partial [Sphingomonadales bacterium]|nr:hypothetical protein [Sphingomonadales bacterium]